MSSWFTKGWLDLWGVNLQIIEMFSAFPSIWLIRKIIDMISFWVLNCLVYEGHRIGRINSTKNSFEKKMRLEFFYIIVSNELGMILSVFWERKKGKLNTKILPVDTLKELDSIGWLVVLSYMMQEPNLTIASDKF